MIEYTTRGGRATWIVLKVPACIPKEHNKAREILVLSKL